MLAGSIVALVTPMHRSGEIDWPALDRLIDWHLESGTHGIVPMGTTGESPTLNVDEHIKVIERTVVRVAKRIPVDRRHRCECDGRSHRVDARSRRGRRGRMPARDAVLQQADAGRSVSALQGDRRGGGHSAGAVQRSRPHRVRHESRRRSVGSATIDNIIGIKEACGDVERVDGDSRCSPPDFIVLSGEDAQTFDMMKLGAVGTISVTANVLPREMAQFVSAYLDGDEAARRGDRRAPAADPPDPVRRNEPAADEVGAAPDGQNRHRHPACR